MNSSVINKFASCHNSHCIVFLFQHNTVYEVRICVGLSYYSRLLTGISFRIFMAVLPSTTFRLWFLQIPRISFFDFLRMHSIDFRHVMFLFYPSTVVVLRSQHICMGTIHMAHWQGHMRTNVIPFDTVYLFRSCSPTERFQTEYEQPFAFVQALCSALYR